MKEKVNFEENFEIYLFTDPNEESSYSKLNEFISYLKYNKVNLPYKFSYVGLGEGLIPELSLNENILMDFSPDSLTADRQHQFIDFLRDQPNRSLEELYKKIHTPNEEARFCDTQMKKITSLIKSLIFEGQFIFLECPEVELAPENLELFICALKEHITKQKLNVFIFSNELPLWIEHVHHHVQRQKDYSFKTQKISPHIQWRKQRDVFFKSRQNAETELQFHFPKVDSGKKSAA